MKCLFGKFRNHKTSQKNVKFFYNNCMKLASLYIVRDELRQKESRYGNYNYNYYPMYEHMGNNGNNGSSSYGYKEPMYYNNEDLIIKKDMMGDYPKRG